MMCADLDQLNRRCVNLENTLIEERAEALGLQRAISSNSASMASVTLDQLSVAKVPLPQERQIAETAVKWGECIEKTIKLEPCEAYDDLPF